MREIEFKGKRKDNGEWVYGYIHKYDNAEQRGNVYIIPSHASVFYSYEVFPETVGQYTGLKDRNGKKIFENDIMRHYNFRCFEQIYNIKNLYQVVWVEYDVSFSLYFMSQGKAYNTNHIISKKRLWSERNIHHEGSAEEHEVIGNIYDNPELLKLE